ncbi:hypothetical protein C8035_v005015 [Colletotrichum spinosum]|uniref:Uncharacterized protein n=1 Tax=Colletotrichum spinosum TaxID=1347390 RepID=A0A4R8Q267_9PEZI|nr:hypothetical protein C8035_v005015 [Colletotrichum spinosum]
MSYNKATTTNNNNKNKLLLSTITILNPYNFNININLIKVVNNYRNYNYFYKSLKRLVLYKSDFTTLASFYKIIIIIFSFNVLLEDEAISRTKKKTKVIKKNLVPKTRIFKDNSKYFKFMLEVAYQFLFYSEKKIY